ncbi:MAG: NAD(P)H-dependent oxidoreductase subunit E [Candidatus Paracaedibacteraceae bacterium]|nr:NAD(P)H-dependent oxidoreductase subunit E [Candidatus Paracaedibacteraceae bacterium]
MNKPFTFSIKNQEKIPKILARYPSECQQSAVMPLLDLAQEQNGGWLSQSAIEAVAAILNMPIIRVQEVVTFYSMYRVQPVGKTIIQVCTTTPCWLRGSDVLIKACRHKLGISPGETKDDISLFEVECLGACINAPVVQINNDEYIEDLDVVQFETILESITNDQGIKQEDPKSKTPTSINVQKVAAALRSSKEAKAHLRKDKA